MAVLLPCEVAWPEGSALMSTDDDQKCRCHLPIKPPASKTYWWLPHLEDEPEDWLRAVARFGEDPRLRRAIRTPTGWIERRPLVAYYEDRTPPMPWWKVGYCWAGTAHPVVPCETRPDHHFKSFD